MLGIQKKLSKSFLALLSLPATAVGFALSTQIAALSWLLSTRFGLDIHDVAVVWLAGPMAGIVGQPIVGAISDNAWFLGGRRKGFIMIGGILGALMFLTLPQIGIISSSLGFEGVIVVATVVALLLDLSINITFNPARSIIADLTPEGKKRTSGFTIMQLISGIFGLLAYFISIVLGNITLIYIAVVLVLLFSVVPCFFIKEDRNMSADDLSEEDKAEKTSVIQIFKIIYPLSGFLLFAFYLILDKLILHGKWEAYQVNMMYLSVAITIILGIIIVFKGMKKQTNENEFHKIMVAHSFSWLGIQSMFVMSFFFAKEIIVPNLIDNDAFANSFTTFFTGKTPSIDDTAGNILSLAFLLFNAVGAFFPVLVLEPISKKIGRVRTYFTSILIMAIAYLFIWKFGNTELTFYTGICIAGIGWSAVISIVFAIMSERVNQSKMGLYMGLFNYSVVLPQMMTVGIAALVKESNDYSMLYLMCGISLFVSFLFWLFVKEPKSSSNSHVPSGGGH
ncbi:hypothetical protein UJ101_00744 [Flavobacteriaceae bacterium UJ101]|nr:hypothetical protein UJ101_00744 [Flavobacteriaceae bacterium UJ101]